MGRRRDGGAAGGRGRLTTGPAATTPLDRIAGPLDRRREARCLLVPLLPSVAGVGPFRSCRQAGVCAAGVFSESMREPFGYAPADWVQLATTCVRRVGATTLQRMAIVFLHASNRSPDRAWSAVGELPGARFAVMPGYSADGPAAFHQDRWEARLLEACDAEAAVVAHSFGGPVAMRAAARRPDLIRALVLFEPAAYALARGSQAVEDHIRRAQPVLDRAATLPPAEFAVAFAAALAGRTIAPPTGAADLLAAERQRRLPGPWTLDTPARVGVPTLVVTGGWNDEYEAIASRVVGARHVTLAGHGHRPQDHPDAVAVVRAFLDEA